ncbi:nucleotidyltransferase family protein [Ravibacter arvi]|uniref:Nucleotidyltransferase family protein n=1 Tax=Ravibacter arvi TaxID=2051041 RepID=A0ABP8LZT5_9BACT
MKLSKKNIEALKSYFSSKPVKRAYLFGSYSRGEAKATSDVDILVELDHTHPIGLRFFQFKDELQELLARKVDLISEEGLSVHVRPFVVKDRILIYER